MVPGGLARKHLYRPRCGPGSSAEKWLPLKLGPERMLRHARIWMSFRNEFGGGLYSAPHWLLRGELFRTYSEVERKGST